jgi:pyruvate kinase
MSKPVDIHLLLQQLLELRAAMLEREANMRTRIDELPEHSRESAVNLVHYLAMRTTDLRSIQEQLATLGLSSIGHSERYTLVNLDNIIHLLRLLGARSEHPEVERAGRFSLDYPRGIKRLREHTHRLFGGDFKGTRIMVTLPTESSESPDLLVQLLEAGMHLARINCSHDSPEVWEAMLHQLRQAQQQTGKNCLVYMDLPGPKIRTGAVALGKGTRKKKKKGDKDKKPQKGPAILLREGDTLLLHRGAEPGHRTRYRKDGSIKHVAILGCTLPSIIDDVKPGDRIWFDDGKLGGTVEKTDAEGLHILINHAGPEGSKLRADKGINLPDTLLTLPALTEQDLEILPFAVKHADLVGYSFVRTPQDIRTLRGYLRELGRESMGLILKIENREAFRNLPLLLLEAMASPSYGVMIARGDLAIELGFTRIAEVQEELLWLCDAAHAPIIWATQVLEKLAKEGLASRAEITDAAMSVRAECVMLNKGPYIVQAVRTLTQIDQLMRAHQFKKQGALRPLQVARRFFDEV